MPFLMRAAELPLAGGWHAGPLFVLQVKRPPLRPKGCTVTPGRLRRAAEKRATPAWADAAATRAVFAQAEALTHSTGQTHSADHLVPLSHPLVCGLHWDKNMTVETLASNMRKGNHWWPDMWGEQVALIDE